MNKIKKILVLFVVLIVLSNGNTEECHGAVIPRTVDSACLDRRSVAMGVK